MLKLYARWTTGEANVRPYLATECDNVKDCEKWRQQIVREVAKMVAQIQNAGTSKRNHCS